ncbi:MAG: 1-phosphofructokinase family hexose kinase [Spirochaetaceae bacterium]|jgi:1-phosphofructokinase|nr:1-phosphofructokinase family hexose kinase [Spirochaetaceae bacterium]
MIITVTLNPALDKSARVNMVRPNALNRLHDITQDAGGKGINVSAMIRSLGGESIALGFSGGSTGEELQSLVAKKGLQYDFVHIAGVTRTNLKIMSDDRLLTEFNEPGPTILSCEWHELEQKLLGHGTRGNTIVLSGSLPLGLGKDTYKKISVILRKAGAAVFLDTDGEALKQAIDSGPEGIPDYIKPNRYELLRYFGVASDGIVAETKLVELCHTLIGRGIKLVALSLGRVGAIFVSKKGVWRSAGISVPVRSTVGAGDSMTGALVYGFEQGLGEEQCFALATAASAGASATEGNNPPLRTLVDSLLTQTRIEKIG